MSRDFERMKKYVEYKRETVKYYDDEAKKARKELATATARLRELCPHENTTPLAMESKVCNFCGELL